MVGWRHHYDKASTSLTAPVHALIDLDNGWLEAGCCYYTACNGEMTNERHI